MLGEILAFIIVGFVVRGFVLALVAGAVKFLYKGKMNFLEFHPFIGAILIAYSLHTGVFDMNEGIAAEISFCFGFFILEIMALPKFIRKVIFLPVYKIIKKIRKSKKEVKNDTIRISN
jgi:hypothetical protein